MRGRHLSRSNMLLSIQLRQLATGCFKLTPDVELALEKNNPWQRRSPATKKHLYRANSCCRAVSTHPLARGGLCESPCGTGPDPIWNRTNFARLAPRGI